MAESRVTEQLEVEADTSNLVVVREFLLRAIKRSAMPPEDVNRVILAVDEALANTMEHGYEDRAEGAPPGRVEILVEAEPSRFTIKLRDNGLLFDSARNSEGHEKLDLQQHIAEGNRRGLGLFIMRRVMDEIRYSSREGGRNELTLVKYIRPAH